MVLICFSYVLLLWFVYGLVLPLWFWYGFSCDFDIGQNCDLDVGQKCENNLNTYRNHIRITSKSPQNRIKTVSYHIKIISKHIQPKKTREIDQKPVPGPFLFPFLKRTHREAWKRLSVPKLCQNHVRIISKVQTISKPYLNHNSNHIKFTTKPYRNHHPKFNAYEIHILKSHQNHIKLKWKTTWIWLPGCKYVIKIDEPAAAICKAALANRQDFCARCLVHFHVQGLPSGKDIKIPKNRGTSPFSWVNQLWMAIFNSKLLVYQRVIWCVFPGLLFQHVFLIRYVPAELPFLEG